MGAEGSRKCGAIHLSGGQADLSDPVAEYLRALSQKHHTGQATDETSYYPPLEQLLNLIGATLSPSVGAVMTIRNRGAGIPDGGLFEANQFRGKARPDVSVGNLPARGALEVKPPSVDIEKLAASEQAERYLARYGQVLLSNYRDFALLGRGPQGRGIIIDRFTLATSEEAFWSSIRSHDKAARESGDGLTRFLQRCMVRPAPISSPEDLAWVLAQYAQEALQRVEKAPLTALDNFKKSLEEALVTRFDDKKGIHFFHSTLVQTLFYGIFSAWVIWCREVRGGERFNWKDAAWTLQLPAIKSLFSEIATPRRIQYLDIGEVLDWTGEALARVDRKVFFDRFDDRLAIQYFYEPFLEHFDPDLRKELGVWYTPPEVVHYMVERIDAVLRSELGIEEGFASKDVFVLDPCAGTGSFLLEVLHRIAKTWTDRGDEEFAASEVKTAAMERVFGFEIIPAPFVVSHLQIGLFLASLGAPLNPARDERASVFLTNSLTGWEPPRGPQKQLTFIELQEEREAADKVKRSTPILVVLGNPPYNAYAGTSPEEERGLVDVYKAGLRGTWNIKKFNLDELYVRFMRIAERQIAEHSRRGVVCYISSYSYLSDPSFVILRERFHDGFDKAWIDSLNGDSRETGKRTPTGLPDPSIFSTERNREGIRLGTAIGLFVKSGSPGQAKDWRYRDFWGTKKRRDLVDTLKSPDFQRSYNAATPTPANHYNFRPVNVTPSYYSWPSVADLCRVEGSNGLMEKRRSTLISVDPDSLRARMKAYLDKGTDWESLGEELAGLRKDAARFNARKAREKACQKDPYRETRLLPYVTRPFDVQYAYYTPIRPIWNEPRPWLWAQFSGGNEFLVTRRHGSKLPEGPPFWWTSKLFDDSLLHLHATAFPVRVRDSHRRLSEFKENDRSAPISHNYSSPALVYLSSLGVAHDEAGGESLLWQHALAIGFSEKYLVENADGIKQDWPRIPLPSTREILEKSAKLGQSVAHLLDTPELPGVTRAPVRVELQSIGKIRTTSGKPVGDEASLLVSAGWGRIQQDGVYPGSGKIVVREYTEEEIHALGEGATNLGKEPAALRTMLGEQTCDVYLNEDTYWANIPESVWTYHIGGQQVLKKWLSYRESAILGRPLSLDEARNVRDIARRLAAILILEPDLDANYVACREAAVEWAHSGTAAVASKTRLIRRRKVARAGK